jgi:hypothetical protein
MRPKWDFTTGQHHDGALCLTAIKHITMRDSRDDLRCALRRVGYDSPSRQARKSKFPSNLQR